MNSIRHPSVATSVQTCSGRPDQHEGTLTTGEHFYFRYRWGFASLGIGPDTTAAVDDSEHHDLEVGGPMSGEFESVEQREAVFAQLLTKAQQPRNDRT